VGESVDASGESVLAEGWNGSKWSAQPIHNPEGAELSTLTAVSCTSSEYCFAVGYYSDNGTTLPLAEAWNGVGWSILPTAPVPPGAQFAELAGVACFSRDECVAVGSYYNGSAVLAFAEGWNGSAWSIQSIPNPSAAQGSALYGVSCPAALFCSAVGSYSDSIGTWSLAETWNGSVWSVQRTGVPTGAQQTTLYAVACPTGTSCTAVGDYANSISTSTLAMSWNGSKWTTQKSRNPAGSFASVLNAVSCPAAGDCIAAGDTSIGFGAVPLAEGWDGSAWKLQSAPYPAGASNAGLLGLSCRSIHDCTAVGSYDNLNGTASLTLAEIWNGTAWAIQATPNPRGAQQDNLYGASCSPLGGCIAVGSYAVSPESYPLPLAERYRS
jgi:hypothetical protein